MESVFLFKLFDHLSTNLSTIKTIIVFLLENKDFFMQLYELVKSLDFKDKNPLMDFFEEIKLKQTEQELKKLNELMSIEKCEEVEVVENKKLKEEMPKLINSNYMISNGMLIIKKEYLNKNNCENEGYLFIKLDDKQNL